jgi:hypothetical protein
MHASDYSLACPYPALASWYCLKTIRIMAIIIDSNNGNIVAGGNNTDGDLQLRSTTGQNRIHLDGQGGNAWLGANGADGDLVIFPSTATNNNSTAQSSIHLDGQDANIWMGGNGRDGDIVIFPSSATNNHDTAQATIHLDGNAGDIVLRNADFAEDFDIVATICAEVQPGTVMVLNQAGQLDECAEEYDKKVAGVISGAGKYKPGIIMDKQPETSNRLPVALSGKVMCKVDATFGEVEVGDLLTSSTTKGFARKATDPAKAFGSIIGKALGPLKEGQGFIPILVSLQ